MREKRKVSPPHYHRFFREISAIMRNRKSKRNKQEKRKTRWLGKQKKTVGHKVDVILIVRMQLNNTEIQARKGSTS